VFAVKEQSGSWSRISAHAKGNLMQIVDHERQTREEWRSGVVTCMRISALTGSARLCVFEQWCQPGKGAPTHLHSVEEILTVLEGEAECWVEDRRSPLSSGKSVIVPAGLKHGFRNIGRQTLHLQAILAAPVFEAIFDDGYGVARRWMLPTENDNP
jgi:mannose-6-phosphate isomerase-like protein (cupin superfamily)